MKRKKLLKTLAAFLNGEGRQERQHRDDLETLLAKLKKKEVELEERLRAEKNARKKERLGKELEIVKAQHAKGAETLQELKKP